LGPHPLLIEVVVQRARLAVEEGPG
jgi:hypothetical protein